MNRSESQRSVANLKFWNSFGNTLAAWGTTLAPSCPHGPLRAHPATAMISRNTFRTFELTLGTLSLALLTACGGASPDTETAAATPATSPVASADASGNDDGTGIPADATRLAIDEPGANTAAATPRESSKAVGTATPKVAILAWSNYTSDVQQAHVARFNVALLALPQTATPATVAAAVAALKSRNASLQVAQTTTAHQVSDSVLPLATPTTANNWWLKTAAGARTSWQGSAGIYDTNITSFTAPDASGKRFPQFKASSDSTTFFKAAPGIDFVFSNLVWPQAVAADWKRLGTNQVWTDPTVQAAQRVGHAAYWDALRVLHPSLKVIANVSPQWQASAEFAGKTHGSYLNSVIGRTWSIETSTGWPAMMAQYRAALANTLAPKAVIFNAAAASADYRTMRFALASAMLEDGYFSLSATDGPQPAPWMDEFSAPIGTAAALPPTAAAASGLWSRAYSNGLVLVNPSKTASATITLPAGYKRLAGVQAPAVNSGAVATTVTLAPRDGLLLLKTTTPPPPPPADTQPPTPPSGLLTSGLACRSVTLSWAASSDNIGVTGYDIYHDGQQMTSVNGSTRSVALTLTPGASWGLYVNARDAAGNVSQASPIVTIQIPLCQTDTAAPTAPTNLQGTVAGTSAYLTWSAASDNIGVTAYDIYRNNVKVGSTGSLAFTDSGLAANTTYPYTLAARDAAGNTSARSLSLSLTTGGACANVVCAVTQVATESDIPWGLAALPDGTVLYSRRDVLDIVRLNPATGVKTSLGTLPLAQGTNAEGGMMGIAVSPNFPATDPWLYVYHSTATDNRVVRVQYKSGALDLATHQVLLSGIGRNAYHNGGRLRYGPDGKLYVATGDAQNGGSAQNLGGLAGKILRLNPDGSRPADNPFASYVWSYGHRNPQGLAFDAQGRLWQQEFGNSLMDETNLIQKGGNYGWPNCEGTASVSGTGCATAGYIAPKMTYLTADGSCSGITVVRGALYIACQRSARVYRWVISGSDLTNVQQLFAGTYGRIRTVEPSIDGGLWLATTNGGDKDSIANNSNNKIIKVNLGN